MSEEYYPEIHEKIYPEAEVKSWIRVYADRKRKGKTAKLESVDIPLLVYYSQFKDYDNTRVSAFFSKISTGNYTLSVTGEDRKEYVTVFDEPLQDYEW